MYELNDTIAAVSSPTSEKHVIIRLTGPDTINVLNQIFSLTIRENKSVILSGQVTIDSELKIDAKVYLFIAPYSYTGETLAEIHIYTNASVTEALIRNLLSKGIRAAGPGEFTARSFLNGKIDLAQAEAVNEIIASSNKFQLAAAEKLLAGKLGQTTEKIGGQIMDCLSLLEAGMDFSGEDIEFITADQTVERLTEIKNELHKLFDGSISYESVVDLPSVGIAGSPNAGKSSLLNKLLGKERSIVSAKRKTTRDVLTATVTLLHYRAVLFDCAGLMKEPENILDELAQKRAVESLNHAQVVAFCVDVTRQDWSDDLSILKLIKTKTLIPAATKSDLLSKEILASRIAELNKLFNVEFLPTSAKTSIGLEQLRDTIDKKLIEQTLGSSRDGLAERASAVALTARHRQAVTNAIENVGEAINELKTGNDEVAAMLLRAAYQSISDIEQHVDEEILERIFSRFCIGK
jgi:tRNA modification GTPase